MLEVADVFRRYGEHPPALKTERFAGRCLVRSGVCHVCATYCILQIAISCVGIVDLCV